MLTGLGDVLEVEDPCRLSGAVSGRHENQMGGTTLCLDYSSSYPGPLSDFRFGEMREPHLLAR